MVLDTGYKVQTDQIKNNLIQLHAVEMTVVFWHLFDIEVCRACPGVHIVLLVSFTSISSIYYSPYHLHASRNSFKRRNT